VRGFIFDRVFDQFVLYVCLPKLKEWEFAFSVGYASFVESIIEFAILPVKRMTFLAKAMRETSDNALVFIVTST
jgi:hypothetical protein